MKKILVVTTSFPSDTLYSGREAAGSFVYDFVQELSKRANVTVVAPGITSYLDRNTGFSIRYFPVPELPLSLLKPANPLKWPAIIKTLSEGKKAVLNAVENFKPDHVLALWALPSGYWAKVACKTTGTPYSTWALGSDIWSLGKIPVVRQILRATLRSGKYCFADGIQLASDVSRISGKPCDFLPSCRKLPVTGKSRKLSSEPPYKLAFLGRWHKNKGIDLLFESLKLLSDDDWKHIKEIRINGGGPLCKLVQEEAKYLQAKGHPVTVGGYLNINEAVELYQWTDYVLIPSRIESIPVVFSDAMQSKCPVIAMPVGDLPRLVKQFRVGFTAHSVNAVAFKKAIGNAISLPAFKFSNALLTIYTEFNPLVVVDTILDTLYKSSS